jgi:hypothetical protein
MAADTPADLRRSALTSALIREAILEKLAWLRATPFWAVSALAHLALLLVLLTLVVREERAAAPPGGDIKVLFQPRPVPVAVPRPNPQADRTAEPKPTRGFPRILKPVPVPVINELPPETKTSQRPKGFEQNIRQRGPQIPSIGIFDPVIGPESMSIGGPRGTPEDEGPGPGADGPPPELPSAVEAALDWLVRHQSPDGSWKAAGFLEGCKSPCRNLDATHGDGRGWPAHDVGVTALAMLAFTGYGHTHWDGVFEEYTQCMRNAVQFLKRVQVRSNDPATNGRYGTDEGEQWMYNHAIATMAMAELLVLSNDVIGLKPSVTDAVRLCLHAQNSGSGWRYGIKPGENDTSVTGWMVLALKTAKNAKLDIPREDFQTAFAGALNWFGKATASNGKTGYMAPGDEGSRLNEVYPEPYPFSKDLSSMTAVGVLCRLLAGEGRGSRTVREGVKILMKHTPRWQERKGRALSTINIYYWYYGSYALFQYGGPEWKRWSKDMIAALVDTQRKGQIDEDGSWDPYDEWGPAGGRVYSTALGALTLEVYHRARRLEQLAPLVPRARPPAAEKGANSSAPR